MSIFDKLKSTAQQSVNTAVTGAVRSVGNRTERFTFSALPESLAQMQAMPEASLDTPFKAAALTVCALCAYAADRNVGTEMLNWLRGPRPLNGQDISFLNDRFRDGKTYLPFTYFVGATPDNNYTPAQPYVLEVLPDPRPQDVEAGYLRFYLKSGGADSPRPLKLRQKGNQWFLWEYSSILSGVRIPAAEDPWM